MSEQLSPFHAALTAFEIRFEIELTSRWQKLESEAGLASSVHNPPTTNRSVLDGFFKDVENEISSVVHEYFPRLLHVATAQRHYLGNESPIDWTQAQVLRQVCNFLGVDEKFDHTFPPRDNSRLVQAAARIALNVGSLDEAIPSDFVLPGWLHTRWAMRRALLPDSLRGQDDAESLSPLTRIETLEWLKQREFWISRRLERQIENEVWDGIIEAGKSNVSVLVAFVPTDEPASRRESDAGTEHHECTFVREVTTWNILFGREACRLAPVIGLDYISVLLEHPGRPIRALELQGLAGGVFTGFSSSRLEHETKEGAFREKTDKREGCSFGQSDCGRDEMVDDSARRQAAARQLEIEKEIAYRSEIGDEKKSESWKRRCGNSACPVR